ncbi:DUF2312 domain-containing protein [Dyadobacter sp. CY261]|uniref:DUF2312 domain-containing protein n=1 Tax=Dyadobacter sp. CY261 TaxID=2907203 RepID=UPI001F1F8AD9|nr:DUF2312 domain-containing protein [Dyadobacter sp. CY261]MCF0075453.1 DUF2312 domain-containing protein [Dyadobacter sp. CY261]
MTEEQSEAGKSRLAMFITRIESLSEQKKAIGQDISDVYSEAKSEGYDVKAMREVVKLRAMPSDKRTDFVNATDSYAVALGVV